MRVSRIKIQGNTLITMKHSQYMINQLVDHLVDQVSHTTQPLRSCWRTYGRDGAGLPSP